MTQNIVLGKFWREISVLLKCLIWKLIMYTFFSFTFFLIKLYFDHRVVITKLLQNEPERRAFQYFCLTTFFQILSISMEFQEFFHIPVYLCLMIKQFTNVNMWITKPNKKNHQNQKANKQKRRIKFKQTTTNKSKTTT